MWKITCLTILTFFLFQSSLPAQDIHIEVKEGGFEKFAPWGDGFLGVISLTHMNYRTKSREFIYYNENGEKNWSVDIDPYNWSNEALWSTESEYAFFVNFAFHKIAVADKRSKENLLHIHRLDKQGNLIEKAFPFAENGLSEILNQDKHKNMREMYATAHKDGLIIVIAFADYDHQNFLFLDNEMNLVHSHHIYPKDDKAWVKQKLSKPQYLVNDKYFGFAWTELNEKGLVLTMNRFEIANPDTPVKGEFVLLNDGHDLYATWERESEDKWTSHSEYLNMWYYKDEQIGASSNYRRVPTLGAFTWMDFSNDGITVVGHYQDALDQKKKKSITSEGYLVYNIDLTSQQIASKPKVLQLVGSGKPLEYYGFFHSADGEVIAYGKTETGTLINSTKSGLKELNEKPWASEIFGPMITDRPSESFKGCNYLIEMGKDYYGIDLNGDKKYEGSYPIANVWK